MTVQPSLPPKLSRTTHSVRPFWRAMAWPAVAVGVGALLTLEPPSIPLVPAQRSQPAVVAPAPAHSDSYAHVPTLPRSMPKRLLIPRIGVDAPFTELSLTSSGQLGAPPPGNANLVGWYQGAASPGEVGASIVVGHLDTKTGPAVFVYLSKLKAGDKIDVVRADGIIVTFMVDSVNSFSKAHFPDRQVYSDSPRPELRLITCGGTYDRKARDYMDNVVVFAHLDASKHV
ncbi:class F sortase [Streptomyces sp. NPDC097981]|uniref:class F sortase n=1 Tax=Streptomyces sp. NPDC097981 TaxID=3155428 RepID=UPI00331C2BD7